MILLIVGITGNLGHRLAKAALDRGLKVRGLGRSPDKLNAEINAQLESFVASKSYYDVPAIEKAMSGADAVICAYSTNPVLYLDGALLLLRAAERSGIKIFVAPSWTSNWTRIQYGEVELYDSVLAFKDQAALTSSIRPVYIVNGAFAEYTLAPGGPFEIFGATATFRYWGNVADQKVPWTTMDDAATWTIELLLTDDNVKNGSGGIFQFQSGCNSYRELARTYEEVTGIKVELVCEGDADLLKRKLEEERQTKGNYRFFEYLYLAWSRVAIEGRWQLQEPIEFAGRPATDFKEHLTQRAQSETL